MLLVKINKYVIKLYVIAFSILIIMIIGFFGYLNSSIGSNKVLEEYYSPDNRYKVVVFERDGGATTGFSTQVSIIPAKSSLGNKAGNIFFADTNHGQAPSGKGGGPEVRVTWVGNETVILSYDKNARIFQHEKKFNNIRIDYQEY